MQPTSEEPRGQGLLNKPDPKAQEQVDIFVANGIQIIHEQKISDDIIRRVQGSQDPIEAIAQATVQVVEMLERHARAKGSELTNATKIHGSNQLMGEIINLVEKAGVVEPLTEEQKYQAFSMGVSMYLDNAVKSGKMPREQLAQLADEASRTPEGQSISRQMQQETRGASPGVVPRPGVGVPLQPGRDVA